MEQIYDYTIKLIRYVLNGDIPELPENIDFEKLFALGRSHGVENMLYVGLRDLKIAVPEDTMKKFKKAYEMSIMVEATQALELEAISEAFEEAGIDYVPLKGSVVKYLYPMPDYRKSGDIDILIKPEDEETIDRIMTDLGWTRETELDGYGVHFSYNKKPFGEAEMHRRLVPERNRSSKFCALAWDNASLMEGTEHHYILNNEFIYVYLMSHLCHHLYRGGAGIRLISDLYVIKQKVKLDDEKLKKNLKLAKLTELDRMINKLIEKWFNGEAEQEKDINVLERIVLTGGSFGTLEMRRAMETSNTTWDKVSKLLRKFFPHSHVLKGRYPVLKQKPYLLIFFWIYRFLDIGFFERDTIAGKLEESTTAFHNEYRNKDIKNIVKAVRTRY
ncbi:MAG: nucleotidyltransferase family protein [Suilimivivens sp.]